MQRYQHVKGGTFSFFFIASSESVTFLLNFDIQFCS